MLDEKTRFNQALGKRLRQARDRAGLKQEQLADLVGLSRVSITNIERGRQGVHAFLLVKLSTTLRQPVQDLLPAPTDGAVEGIPEAVQQLAPDQRAWAEQVLCESEDDHNGEA